MYETILLAFKVYLTSSTIYLNVESDSTFTLFKVQKSICTSQRKNQRQIVKKCGTQSFQFGELG